MTGSAGVEPPALEVRTSAGPIRYHDTGEGPALVFVHGLLANGAHWRKVVPLLSDQFRCIVPDWPLGAHRVPMAPDADLSPPGLARTIAEVLGSLELQDATLVGNDTGGALCQLVAAAQPERLGAMVLSDCDTYENFLPRLFRPLQVAGRVPGGILVLAQGMRARALWRLPVAFGRLIKHDIDPDVVESYFEPSRSSREVRRDAAKVLRGISSRYTVAAAEQLRSFARPVLLAWHRRTGSFRFATRNAYSPICPRDTSSSSRTPTRSPPRISPDGWPSSSPRSYPRSDRVTERWR